MKTWHWGNVSRPGSILEISWLHLTGTWVSSCGEAATISPYVRHANKTAVMWRRTTQVWICVCCVSEDLGFVETTILCLGSSRASLLASCANSSSCSSRRAECVSGLAGWLAGSAGWLTASCLEFGAVRPEFRKTSRLRPPQAGSQEEAGWEGMAWSVFPIQRTRFCGVWRRSSSARGHRLGSRHYDGRLPLLRGRWFHGAVAVGQKERGNSGFDRFVFQDAIQSEGSHSSGKTGLFFQCVLSHLSTCLVSVLHADSAHV